MIRRIGGNILGRDPKPVRRQADLFYMCEAYHLSKANKSKPRSALIPLFGTLYIIINQSFYFIHVSFISLLNHLIFIVNLFDIEIGSFVYFFMSK